MKIFLFLLVATLTFNEANAETEFEFQPYVIPEAGRIVVPVKEGETLSGLVKLIDKKTNGAVTIAAKEAEFVGEVQSTLTLLGALPYSRIDLIGVGTEAVSRVDAENFGGAAAQLLASSKGGTVQILWPSENLSEEATAARVALGYQLRAYTFDQYKQEPADPALKPKIILMSDVGTGDQYHNDLAHLAEGVYFARDMSSHPGNVIYPESFVEQTKTMFKGLDNIEIKVLDEKDIQRLEMGALWGVGKGSVRPPRLMLIEYKAGGDEAPIVLAGKGITFDTGGISLKPNKNMWMMKGDLGGAGVVTGTVLSAAKRGAEVNVVAIVALAENMPSGVATRPGDLLTSMRGITIEISSTDAEGRLVLADAVHYAQVKYQPSVLINVATLTGSVGRALGDEYAGIFARHDAIVEELSNAAARAGESVWRLPLDTTHFKQIESNYGDIINSGVGSPGASVGAAFIGSFVDEDQVWAHFDIAGVDFYEEDKPTTPKGYSGWGVRTLDEYLRSLAKKPLF